jgi:hypothetical protein
MESELYNYALFDSLSVEKSVKYPAILGRNCEYPAG